MFLRTGATARWAASDRGWLREHEGWGTIQECKCISVSASASGSSQVTTEMNSTRSGIGAATAVVRVRSSALIIPVPIESAGRWYHRWSPRGDEIREIQLWSTAGFETIQVGCSGPRRIAWLHAGRGAAEPGHSLHLACGRASSLRARLAGWPPGGTVSAVPIAAFVPTPSPRSPLPPRTSSAASGGRARSSLPALRSTRPETCPPLQTATRPGASAASLPTLPSRACPRVRSG